MPASCFTPARGHAVVVLPDPLATGLPGWLTRLAHELGEVQRVRFDRPRGLEPATLARAVQRAVDACSEAPVILAHGEGCGVLAAWAQRPGARCLGALLVDVPAQAVLRAPVQPLPFPALVAYRGADTLAARAHAHECARIVGGTPVLLELGASARLQPLADAAQARLWLDTVATLGTARRACEAEA